MSSFIIYKTTNLVNGKYYIGKHCTSADDGYLGSGIVINKAIKKYGKENFVRETLEYCTSADANDKEIQWISKLGSRNHDVGYNLTDGGEGSLGYKWTEKQIQSHRIGTNNPNYGNGDKIRGPKNHFYGRKHSDKSKMLISQNHADFGGSNHPLWGIGHSQETRDKMSKIKTGTKLSQRTKKKISKYIYNVISPDKIVYDNIELMSEFCQYHGLDFHRLNGNFRSRKVMKTNHKGWIIKRRLK